MHEQDMEHASSTAVLQQQLQDLPALSDAILLLKVCIISAISHVTGTDLRMWLTYPSGRYLHAFRAVSSDFGLMRCALIFEMHPI